MLIGLAAYGIVYGLKQDVGNLKAQQNIHAVVMFAVVAIGLCIISATSHWWLRR